MRRFQAHGKAKTNSAAHFKKAAVKTKLTYTTGPIYIVKTA
jgi:hypothetical protein